MRPGQKYKSESTSRRLGYYVDYLTHLDRRIPGLNKEGLKLASCQKLPACHLSPVVLLTLERCCCSAPLVSCTSTSFIVLPLPLPDLTSILLCQSEIVHRTTLIASTSRHSGAQVPCIGMRIVWGGPLRAGVRLWCVLSSRADRLFLMPLQTVLISVFSVLSHCR